ncbi:MAG: FHA domain-containing protein [Chitinivibrionales bacterium]|nr:FHA domain-containing protein [Chitinivibrionales bacterium]
MPRFTVYYNDRPIKAYDFSDATITIGRLPENSISIPNMGISRRHTRIEIDSNHKYVLSDLNSLNGTFINNKKIKQAQLNNGDKISIGKYTIVYEEPVEAPLPAKPRAVLYAGPVPPAPAPEEHALPQVNHEARATKPPDATPAETQTAVLIETNKHVVHKLDKKVTSIGSDESDDIFVSGFMIGKEQAVIEFEGDEVWIKSRKFGSKFRVNGHKTNNHQLYHKDRIEIGSSTFRYMENE